MKNINITISCNVPEKVANNKLVKEGLKNLEEKIKVLTKEEILEGIVETLNIPEKFEQTISDYKVELNVK